MPETEFGTHPNRAETERDRILAQLYRKLLNRIQIPPNMPFQLNQLNINKNTVFLLQPRGRIQGIRVSVVFDPNTGLWKPDENRPPQVGFRFPREVDLSQQEIERHYIKSFPGPFIVIPYQGGIQILYRDAPNQQNRKTAFPKAAEIITQANQQGAMAIFVSTPWLWNNIGQGVQIASLQHPSDTNRSPDSVLSFISQNHSLYAQLFNQYEQDQETRE